MALFTVVWEFDGGT